MNNSLKNSFLVGEKVYLRRLEESDIGKEYLGWLNDHQVTRYMATGRFPVSLNDLSNYFSRFRNSTTDFIFAIIAREGDQHIGNITLNQINWINRTGDTGLMIGEKAFWGRGYGSEAWRLLLEYAFRQLGLRKIISGAVEDHTSCISVLKKFGFQLEGALRQQVLIDGEYRDALIFGIFRDEFEKYLNG